MLCEYTLKTSYTLMGTASSFVSFIVQFKNCNETTEGDQGNKNRKERGQIYLFADDMIEHISDPKNFTRKLLH